MNEKGSRRYQKEVKKTISETKELHIQKSPPQPENRGLIMTPWTIPQPSLMVQ